MIKEAVQAHLNVCIALLAMMAGLPFSPSPGRRGKAIARVVNYVMLMAQLSKAQSCSNNATPAQRAWGWFEWFMLVMTLILVIFVILICIVLLTMHRKITIHGIANYVIDGYAITKNAGVQTDNPKTDRGMQTRSPQKCDAKSQAPCTYTRKNAQPRFVMLGEHSWG